MHIAQAILQTVFYTAESEQSGTFRAIFLSALKSRHRNKRPRDNANSNDYATLRLDNVAGCIFRPLTSFFFSSPCPPDKGSDNFGLSLLTIGSTRFLNSLHNDIDNITKNYDNANISASAQRWIFFFSLIVSGWGVLPYSKNLHYYTLILPPIRIIVWRYRIRTHDCCLCIQSGY